MAPHAHGEHEDGEGLLRSMSTNDDIDLFFKTYLASPKDGDGGPEWGDRAVWEATHQKDPYPFWLD